MERAIKMDWPNRRGTAEISERKHIKYAPRTRIIDSYEPIIIAGQGECTNCGMKLILWSSYYGVHTMVRIPAKVFFQLRRCSREIRNHLRFINFKPFWLVVKLTTTSHSMNDTETRSKSKKNSNSSSI